MKNAGKVSRRNAERIEEWDFTQSLNMAAVASFILEECDQDINQFMWLCENLLETNRKAKNSSHLHDPEGSE